MIFLKQLINFEFLSKKAFCIEAKYFVSKHYKGVLTTVHYRLSTYFFWYAPRLKYALFERQKKF